MNLAPRSNRQGPKRVNHQTTADCAVLKEGSSWKGSFWFWCVDRAWHQLAGIAPYAIYCWCWIEINSLQLASISQIRKPSSRNHQMLLWSALVGHLRLDLPSAEEITSCQIASCRGVIYSFSECVFIQFFTELRLFSYRRSLVGQLLPWSPLKSPVIARRRSLFLYCSSLSLPVHSGEAALWIGCHKLQELLINLIK